MGGPPRNDDFQRGPPRNNDDFQRGPPRRGDNKDGPRDEIRKDGPPRRFIGKPKNEDAGNDGGNWRGAPRQDRRNPEPAAVNQTQPEKQEQAAPPMKNQEEE